jgi:ankyrin repeat protein
MRDLRLASELIELIATAGEDARDDVGRLIRAGADINAMDTEGRTALILAAAHGHQTTVRLLLDAGADTNVVDNSGRTPLMWAALSGYVDIVQALTDAGATFNGQDDPAWQLTLAVGQENSNAL